MKITKKQKIIISIVGLSLMSPIQAWASGPTTTYTSPKYSATQVFFGAGSTLNSSSANYQAQATVGDLAIGNITSPDYEAYAGFNTTSDPFLEFVVTQSNVNVGVLNTTGTGIANSTFYVRAWQSSGYYIQTVSPPPTNESGDMLAAISSPTVSIPGTEQFGMNLVQNQNPNNNSLTFGANPQQTNSYAFGQAATGYNTTNEYQYIQNTTVADSATSTSSTDYTCSYIFNVSKTTIAGKYVFNQVLVATAGY